MTGQDHDDRLLDELLHEHYATLRPFNTKQRDRVVSRVTEARSEGMTARTIGRYRTWTGVVAAACLIIAALVGTMFLSPATDHAYGIDAVPERLFEVQSIVIRGTQYVFDDANPKLPPVEVPTELLVKRPDKFRNTVIMVGQGNGPVEIRQNMSYLDGQRQTFVRTAEKEYQTSFVSPLDALIKIENRIQQQLASDLLAPPRSSYKMLRTENYAGRLCNVYESRVEDPDDNTAAISTLWFDPTSGLPIRVTFDERQEDGTVRREREYDEIAVNVPLDDSLFSYSPPADFRSLEPPTEDKDEPGTQALLPLDMAANGCATGYNTRICVWHAFRISKQSALVLWRRSEPESAEDGSRDWLSRLEIKLDEEKQRTAPAHSWVYQSDSPDKWNWSLISATDGALGDPGFITFKLRGPRFEGTMGMLALRFSDADLEKILAAAGEAMLPADAPPHTLEALRAAAHEQVNAADAPR
ncbi:MAG TPA: hypothetical protein VGN12_16270 [Pirellulales bacterium]|jgi:outer membrane lipoprotein-sorting protein